MNMKILMLTCVFISLRLVSGICDVAEKDSYITKDTILGVTHATEQVTDDNHYDNTSDINWNINRAIRDIAYYLRAHKFVDYDRRYYNNIEDVKRHLWEEFPRPPLKSLHWEVHKNCDNGFVECVKYLNSIVQQTSLKREDDAIVVIRNNKWTRKDNMIQIINANRECKAAKERDNLTYIPFQGAIERFQWRTTASYYMCWFTMLEEPELYSFNEPCDDYADCLTDLRENRDPRAIDRRPFGCALYSFCPNPCCTMKHIWDLNDCYQSPLNPCYKSNTTAIQKCIVNRHENQNFHSLITNQMNVTCQCDELGYEWSSRFGLCIDINECTRGIHDCSTWTGEICMNLPGDFECVCPHGYIYSDDADSCVENLLYKKIVIQTIVENLNGTKSSSLLDNIVEFLTQSSAIKINYSMNILLILSVLNLIMSY